MCSVPWLNRICRESYSEPGEVYETLKRRGMDLVTVTDHNSIDAAEALRSKTDFFVSEEVTAVTPEGAEIHIGVYGITERQHISMQARRRDLPALLAYLDEHKLLFSINHAFSSLTGRRFERDFHLFAGRFPAVETLNGQIPRASNYSAAAFAARWRKIVVGGSDAHTLECLGRTYTEIPGARNPQDYLERLRLGHGRVYGQSGSYWRLTKAICRIGCLMARENPRAVALAPLLAVVPLVTLVNLMRETAFNYRWSRRAAQVGATPVEPAWNMSL